ncbi:SAM-dependent methyltransferase [Roseovarius sp. Pro17]|uniref:SAM-dependent methyltransferase n=1 Tax=Roseovarius sp. Pro17 TaxID=3108175 RepID=UPI002D76C6C8|nr:SAM-dependent methyltransferase [Roseovarius sp. Pro17]
MGVDLEHLHGLYAGGDDPWAFRTSAYEQQKFAQTRKALARAHYQSAFELGCGNGQLAHHLAGICASYTGMDAVDTALEAARHTVPTANFVKGFYPCALPSDHFDLLIFSEILYFLDEDSIGALATDVAAKWPNAELICVSYLGPSGNELQGCEAVGMFTHALRATHAFDLVQQTEGYRIDRGLPRDGS